MTKFSAYFKTNRRDLIAIATAFVAGVLLIGFIAQFNQLHKVQVQQAEILIQLQKSTSTLKGDNKANLQIIICMLQVPQPQRTTDLSNQCRKQVEASAVANNDTSNVASPPAQSGQGSNSPGAATTQPSNPTPPSATASATATTPPPAPTPVDTCNLRLLGLCLLP